MYYVFSDVMSPGYPLYNPHMIGAHPQDGKIAYQAQPPVVTSIPFLAIDGNDDNMLLQKSYERFPCSNLMSAMNHSDYFHSMEQRQELTSGENSKPNQKDTAMFGLGKYIAAQPQCHHGLATLREIHGHNNVPQECSVPRKNLVITISANQRPVKNHGGVQGHTHPSTIWSPAMIPPTMTSKIRSSGVTEHAHTSMVTSLVTKMTNSENYTKQSPSEEHRGPSKVRISF
jgi:hypothetical protein